MALKLVLDSLDGLSEEGRALYIEKDGKFHLDVEDNDDRSQLKTALDKERKARRDAEKTLKKLEGIDPDEYARLKAEADRLATDRLEGKGEWDKLRDKLTRELDDTKKAHADEIGALKAKLLEKDVRTAALEAGVIPEDLDDVVALTMGSFEFSEDGTVVTREKGAQPTDFYQEYRNQKPKFFKASGHSGGSGSPGNSGGGTDVHGPANSVDKIKAGLEARKA